MAASKSTSRPNERRKKPAVSITKARKGVLGRPPRSKRNLNPLSQVQKVRTYESLQKAKRMARARYADNAATPEGPVGPDGQRPIVTILGPLPPTRRFQRGRKYRFDVCF